ncbi:predicted protein [Pyrenophora tritici-repentis Pt-1C-BFP]|uniref:Uncharacterized protein n=1 Tax=Pyrenophora tritici-repentis (strain Pt-1C-BFP) TaxID=426418 RepID=B2WDW4_PYRTR|nr:uncharacterized protein PTRG_08337 [Pyrenophora tritici-repentis Pt-1C-BFP]EDU51256.1 predicted protein [Pyrenophora tritici-repentis Pt-1C-BFP]
MAAAFFGGSRSGEAERVECYFKQYSREGIRTPIVKAGLFRLSNSGLPHKKHK